MHPERLQKRFDYNISPMVSEELPSFSTKQSSHFKKKADSSLNSTSPIKGRSHLNASFDNRYKHSLPYSATANYSNYASAKAEEIREARDRGGSTNAYRTRLDDRESQNRPFNLGMNEEKRVPPATRPYLKKENAENYADESRQSFSKNNRNSHTKLYSTKNQKITAQNAIVGRHLQENINMANLKLDQGLRQRKGDGPEGVIKQVSEKELVQKISRINRLNEEINSRLQRMLCKIDSYE